MHSADLNACEPFSKIFEAHKERAVVDIRPIRRLLCLFCPAWTFIRPVALPLSITPGIPQLDQLNLIAEFVGDFDATNQSIRVATHKAKLSDLVLSGFARTSRRCHNPVLLIGFHQPLKYVFSTCINDLTGRTCQVVHYVLGKASLNALVAAM